MKDRLRKRPFASLVSEEEKGGVVVVVVVVVVGCSV